MLVLSDAQETQKAGSKPPLIYRDEFTFKSADVFADQQVVFLLLLQAQGAGSGNDGGFKRGGTFASTFGRNFSDSQFDCLLSDGDVFLHITDDNIRGDVFYLPAVIVSDTA